MVAPVKFADFVVTPQVFYRTQLSFSIVNLRPLLPGHVLVCPLRQVPRFNLMTADEVTDLFQAVRVVSKTIERVYGADALNIAIQDGPLAGQSVPHVHCHVIPRRLHDLPNVDDIYGMLDRNDMTAAYQEMFKRSSGAGFEAMDRQNRSVEDMAREAADLRLAIATSLDPNI